MADFDLACEPVLEQVFFERDTLVVARDLLGKVLASSAHGTDVAGRIVETEAYLGAADAGSHAATKGRTARNSAMYGPAGTVYVYFTYGMHHMFNIVCEPEGIAGAVLVRALEPTHGIDTMSARRKGRPATELTNGPGKLAEALGIGLEHNGAMLGTGILRVYDAPGPAEGIERSGRIGLSDGHEHEYRFFIAGNRFVSKARPGVRTPRARTDRRT